METPKGQNYSFRVLIFGPPSPGQTNHFVGSNPTGNYLISVILGWFFQLVKEIPERLGIPWLNYLLGMVHIPFGLGLCP